MPQGSPAPRGSQHTALEFGSKVIPSVSQNNFGKPPSVHCWSLVEPEPMAFVPEEKEVCAVWRTKSGRKRMGGTSSDES